MAFAASANVTGLLYSVVSAQQNHPQQANEQAMAPSKSLKSVPGLNWFGVVFASKLKHNLTPFGHPKGRLHFTMKNSSSTTFVIGMKSGNVDGIGQKRITFKLGSDPYGFDRDDKWYVIDIPMSGIAKEVDLSHVCQLFELLGITNSISDIEFGDICFAGGGKPKL